MKTIFRNLGLGILMAGCVVVTGTKAFAQDAPAADVCKDVEGQQAVYKQYTDNIPPVAAKPTIEQNQAAIKAGDDYVQKYGACTESKEIVSYFNKYLPGMKTDVDIRIKERDKAILTTRFSDAAKAKNTAEIFASGKEILSKEADFQDIALDVALTMTAAGFDQATAKPPVDTYNADTINYAKTSIQKLESGKTSTSWGVWSYNFKLDPKDTRFKDNKAFALGALNYIIGNINYYQLGKNDPAKKKEGLAYFYKATQSDSISKTDASIYQTIGAWYLDEAIKIDGDRQKILLANGNKDNEQTLAMVGQQKGYADRAIDAYSRAYKFAKANPKTEKTYTDNLYARLTDLYKFRYDGKIDGIDAFVTTVDSKPLPDPATAITPVNVEPTDTPTTTTGANMPATDTTKPATTPVKPAATVKPTTVKPTTPTTKPATGATKPAGTANVDATTNDGKAAVKTTTPKKKGTR